MPECSKRVILTVATGVFGITSLICLTIAISTDYWLFAIERFAEDHTATNLTYKLTVTGLWRKCVHMETASEANLSAWHEFVKSLRNKLRNKTARYNMDPSGRWAKREC
ncbi:hypothetical protein HELRODRAFT_162231 [Helobdella robusta]|uniref:Uncharacterized protein n=1 Tax=Helobdella robusta TaxID=6412 RepID=T1ESD9_HELRO|nr:hypothetical protein HELRODRAFT_162231 [Helobdella robusta]ESN98775.1 hypothetical protein HELRODRAFT_162231 [Helobdella robusta]